MTALSRSALMEKFRAMAARGEPIVGGGAGTGLSAKFEEVGGIDLIVIYNSGRYRMAGRGSMAGLLAYGDANAIVVDMAREVLPVVRRTPVLAGVKGRHLDSGCGRRVISLPGALGNGHFPGSGRAWRTTRAWSWRIRVVAQRWGRVRQRDLARVISWWRREVTLAGSIEIEVFVRPDVVVDLALLDEFGGQLRAVGDLLPVKALVLDGLKETLDDAVGPWRAVAGPEVVKPRSGCDEHGEIRAAHGDVALVSRS